MATAKLTTKGVSKITASQVIAARKLYKQNGTLTMQQVKDKLKLKISTIMVSRALRGISHGHLDMCGLPVRPFGTKAKKPTSKPAPKKAAPKKKAPAKVRKPKPAAVPQEPAA